MVLGMKVLVTAGPTREYIDPVRFLSNRSSGKMGYAIAAEAQRRGHDVRLVSGPVSLSVPHAVDCVQVVSAQDMLEAVLHALSWADVLVMCAAVADWRPQQVASQKCKKDQMASTLQLERTADILEAVRAARRVDQLVIGFAAETEAVVAHAKEKLARKGLDLIVANDVSRSDAGFGVDTNVVTLIDTSGPPKELPLLSKQEVAKNLLAWIETHAARSPVDAERFS